MDNPDPQAVLYVRGNGNLYRFKVWEHVVYIERQTPRAYAGNMPFERTDEISQSLYNGTSWDLGAIIELIHRYELTLLSDK